MSKLVTLPRFGVSLTAKGDVPSAEFYRWMHDITERVGGVTGAGTDDLAASQFEDAGIEETKAALYSVRDGAFGIESLVRDLSERVSALERELAGLKQGSLL